MSRRTQLKQDYLLDIAYLTMKCVNFERIFWRFILVHAFELYLFIDL